jgi:hypothetical protein
MAFLDWLFRPVRRRKREQVLHAAATWPTTTAKLLKPSLVDKHELADGSAAQLHQVECSYYFSLETGFFGGHLRSVPCSEGEARRLEKQVAEGMPVTVRYNPQNPDQTCTLAVDNEGTLPFVVWPG